MCASVPVRRNDIENCINRTVLYPLPLKRKSTENAGQTVTGTDVPKENRATRMKEIENERESRRSKKMAEKKDRECGRVKDWGETESGDR